MSVNANYCGTVILLRQLVKEGYCIKNEATRIAALIARQTGVNRIARWCVIPCAANRRWQQWQRHRIISQENKFTFLLYSRKQSLCGLLPIAALVPIQRTSYRA